MIPKVVVEMGLQAHEVVDVSFSLLQALDDVGIMKVRVASDDLW